VEVLGEVVDYAIGMNRPLTDTAAIVFAEAFYGALAMGRTVKESFDLGVSQLEIVGSDECATPVLRIRPGVDPAVPLAARPPEGAPPSPPGGGAGGAPAGGQVNIFETFRGDDALFEALPGSAGVRQENRFGDTSGNRFVFRTGGQP
jgi:hypothetical protein